MAHAQKPDFVFRRNGRVHLNRHGRQFSRLLTAKVCASAVVMLDTPYSEVVWRVLAIHSIRQFPLHFPSHASPCVITFQLDSTWTRRNPYCDYAMGWSIEQSWFDSPQGHLTLHFPNMARPALESRQTPTLSAQGALIMVAKQPTRAID